MVTEHNNANNLELGNAVPQAEAEYIVWRRGLDTKHGFDTAALLASYASHQCVRPILLRFATSEDVKLPPNQRKPSRWYKMMRKRLRKYVADIVIAHDQALLDPIRHPDGLDRQR